MAQFDNGRDPRGTNDQRNGKGQPAEREATGWGAPPASATQQLEELQHRLAALQRFTNRAPRTGGPPSGLSSTDAVYEAERELAELRLAVREQFLRAESLALELTQTQNALAQATAEAERAQQLLRENEARAERQRMELESLRATVDDLRAKERMTIERNELLQRQITELTSSQIELLKARQLPAADPPVVTPAAPAAATFRGHAIEAAPAGSEEKQLEPKKKPQAMFRGRPID